MDASEQKQAVRRAEAATKEQLAKQERAARAADLRTEREALKTERQAVAATGAALDADRELRETCADAGFELRERFGLYPEYVREDAGFDGFGPDAIRPAFERLADDEGLVKREEERW